MTHTIDNISLRLKNNKRIHLDISIKPFPVYSILLSPEFSNRLIYPDFNSIDTIVSYIGLAIDKINPIEKTFENTNISDFQKLSAFFKKLPPPVFKNHLIPQFHKKFTKYIPIHFIKHFDQELYLLQDENLFQVECSHCKFKMKNYFSVNILELVNSITDNLLNRYETKITYETLSLNIRTEHNYNDLKQTSDMKYKHITEYKKQLDEYYKKYIQELRRQQKRKKLT
jgi:hypothetical protein